MIKENGRQIPLSKLDGQKPNIGYGIFDFSTNRQVLDLNGDGEITLSDYDKFLTEFGNTGIYRSDIARKGKTKGSYILGLPDGIVDNNDRTAFVTEYNKKNPDNPIVLPTNVEDFESGDFSRFGWRSSGVHGNWSVVSDNDANHPGAYCAKAVVDTPWYDTKLETTFYSIGGNLTFDMMSNSGGIPNLRVFVDGVEKISWQRKQPWQSASIYVEPGTHTLRFYFKSGTALPDDYVMIDNIVLPTDTSSE